MIYSVVGTNQKIREESFKKILNGRNSTTYIYNEQIANLKPLIDATSLFGDEIIVTLIQTLDKAESREVVYDLFAEMKDSKNLFIMDEPFADSNRIKRMEKYSEKVFDAREEKEKELSPFNMCNSFGRKDKKQTFVEWIKIKDIAEPLEMVHGALWWKIKTIWGDTLDGKKTNFNLDECEKFGEEILRSSLDAHRGKVDLKNKLEEIILKV